MSARPERPAPAVLPSEFEHILHGLRGSLNVVSNHVQVLKYAGLEGKARDSLDTVEREVRRLDGLLNAAFSVLALERGPVECVNVRSVVDSAVAEHGLGAVTVAGDGWPEVQGDRDLLVMAVAHLLRNAWQATTAAQDARPSPEVLVERADATVTLVVRDWGVGLSSTEPRSVIRLGGGRNSQGRQGLGLLVAERVARLHGGALKFRKSPTASTEVCLTLQIR